MEVSLKMPVSQIICVTHYWVPIQHSIFYRVAVLVWHYLLGFAPVYLQELCCPVSTLVGRQALRSSSGGKLLVPHLNTSTMQSRASSVTNLKALKFPLFRFL